MERKRTLEEILENIYELYGLIEDIDEDEELEEYKKQIRKVAKQIKIVKDTFKEQGLPDYIAEHLILQCINSN